MPGNVDKLEELIVDLSARLNELSNEVVFLRDEVYSLRDATSTLSGWIEKLSKTTEMEE